MPSAVSNGYHITRETTNYLEVHAIDRINAGCRRCGTAFVRWSAFMSIRVSCVCGKQIKVKEELAGKRGKCPGCGHSLIVPNLSPPADEKQTRPARNPSCPSCKEALQSNAVICLNCGYDVRTGMQLTRALSMDVVPPVQSSAPEPPASAPVWIVITAAAVLIATTLTVTSIFFFGRGLREPDVVQPSDSGAQKIASDRAVTPSIAGIGSSSREVDLSAVNHLPDETAFVLPLNSNASASPNASVGTLSLPAAAMHDSTAPESVKPVSQTGIRLARFETLKFIDIESGQGSEYEPPDGSIILWVQIDVTNSDILPEVLSLGQVELTSESTTKFALRGIGFGQTEPAIHHLLRPGQTSGTSQMSGDDVGDVVFDAGAQLLTFRRMPSTLSLMFVLPKELDHMVVDGLFGASLPLK
jgi:hypothetical protein